MRNLMINLDNQIRELKEKIRIVRANQKQLVESLLAIDEWTRLPEEIRAPVEKLQQHIKDVLVFGRDRGPK